MMLSQNQATDNIYYNTTIFRISLLLPRVVKTKDKIHKNIPLAHNTTNEKAEDRRQKHTVK